MITDYSQRLRQYLIQLRWPHAPTGFGEVQVFNYGLNDAEQWVLPVGMELDAFAMFVDGGLSGNQYAYGPAVFQAIPMGTFVAGCESLVVRIFPANNFNAVPWVDIEIEGPDEIEVAALGGVAEGVGDFDGVPILNLSEVPAKAYAMPFKIEGEAVRQAFKALRSDELAGTMQIFYTRGGLRSATRPFSVALVRG